MDYQYKIIVSNRTVYKEFEIAAGVENVRLGTTSSCEFRLNPETFFSEIEIEFSVHSNKWINCILAEVTCGKYIPWRSTMEI